MIGRPYIVKGEHTLGFVLGPAPGGGFFQPLAGKVIGASGHDPKNGVACFGLDDWRPATLADFDHFRVMPPPGFSP